MEKGAKDAFSVLTRHTNSIFKNREPWQIVAITATSVLSTVWLWNFVNQDESEFTILIMLIVHVNMSMAFVITLNIFDKHYLLL